MGSGGLTVDVMAIGCLGAERRGGRILALSHFRVFLHSALLEHRSVRGSRDQIFPDFPPKFPDFPKFLGEIPDFPKISPKLSQKLGKSRYPGRVGQVTW